MRLRITDVVVAYDSEYYVRVSSDYSEIFYCISYLDLYCSSFLQNECVEVVKDLFGIIADMYFHGCKIGKKKL